MNKESGNEEASTTSNDTLTVISKKKDDDNNIDESNSSLDTLTGSSEAQICTVDNIDKTVEKKKGRFGSFKNTLFKTKKKNKSLDYHTSTDVEFYEDDSTTKELNNKLTMDDNQIKESVSSTSTTNQTVKKMMKKRKSIVRKLSLNKFRIGTSEQDKQEAPSGQSSPSSSDTVKSILNKTSILKNNNKNDKLTTTTTTTSSSSSSSSATPIFENCKPSYTTGGQQYEQEKGVDVADVVDVVDDEYFIDDTKKPDKFHEKTVKTITLLQTDLPSSVTIGTGNTQQTTVNAELKNNIESVVGDETTISLPSLKSTEEEIIINKKILKKKLNVKSESESSIINSEKPTIELRKKLSLVDEKRAIFQKKYFTSYSKDDSICTVVDKNFDSIADKDIGKKLSRHISVRNFDGLSTIEGADYNDDDDDEEEDISGYIEKNIDVKIDDKIDRTINTPRSLSIMSTESTDMPRRLSGDSGSTHNSVPNSGIGEKREHLYKILVIGELGAGKTSIIKRYVHQFFSQHYRATIGVDFALKVLNWDPHTIIRLQLWDIAGQERFGNMTRVYYKEAVGAFIVFDVTRSATLEAVVKWKQDLDSKVQLPDGSPIPCVLLANKCDQQKEGIVNTPGKMDDYCKEKNFSGWFETSAKENINIEEAARFLVNKILQNDQLMKGNGEQDQTDGERFALNQSPTNSKKSCSC